MSTRAVGSGAVVLMLAACVADRPGPTSSEVTTPLFVAAGATAAMTADNFGTHLAGGNEVFTPAHPGDPTPADSRAQGQAIFRVSADGGTVEFKLIASNIDNVIMAHIHCGRPGANGPIRMWLYPVIGPTGAPGPSGAGRHDGELASGTFSPTGIICPASAVGQDMPLLDAIRAGLAYVNAHTNDGVDGANTGPGDFPGGEIRGQLGSH